MVIDGVAAVEPSWIAGGGDPIELATFASISRNLRGFPFPGKCDKSQLLDAAAILLGEAGRSDAWTSCDFRMLDSLDETSRTLLAENCVITPEMASGGPGRFVMRDAEGVLSCVLNGRDHLCAAASLPGLCPAEAHELAARLVDSISAEFASDPVLGALTASPDIVGLGLKITVALHLPALDISGDMPRVTSSFERDYGSFAELSKIQTGGSAANGSFYELSNRITLGVTAAELCERVESAVRFISSKELFSRHRLSHNKSADISDRLWRAWGLLRHSRKLSLAEALNKASVIKLGADSGALPAFEESDWRRLVIGALRAHLCLAAGRVLEPHEEPFERASIFRKFIEDAGSSAGFPCESEYDKELRK